MNLRSLLYRAASILGDINAAKRGKLPQRIIRKEETKLLFKLLRGGKRK